MKFFIIRNIIKMLRILVWAIIAFAADSINISTFIGCCELNKARIREAE